MNRIRLGPPSRRICFQQHLTKIVAAGGFALAMFLFILASPSALDRKMEVKIGLKEDMSGLRGSMKVTKTKLDVDRSTVSLSDKSTIAAKEEARFPLTEEKAVDNRLRKTSATIMPERAIAKEDEVDKQRRDTFTPVTVVEEAEKESKEGDDGQELIVKDNAEEGEKGRAEVQEKLSMQAQTPSTMTHSRLEDRIEQLKAEEEEEEARTPKNSREGQAPLETDTEGEEKGELSEHTENSNVFAEDEGARRAAAEEEGQTERIEKRKETANDSEEENNDNEAENIAIMDQQNRNTNDFEEKISPLQGRSSPREQVFRDMGEMPDDKTDRPTLAATEEETANKEVEQTYEAVEGQNTSAVKAAVEVRDAANDNDTSFALKRVDDSVDKPKAALKQNVTAKYPSEQKVSPNVDEVGSQDNFTTTTSRISPTPSPQENSLKSDSVSTKKGLGTEPKQTTVAKDTLKSQDAIVNSDMRAATHKSKAIPSDSPSNSSAKKPSPSRKVKSPTKTSLFNTTSSFLQEIMSCRTNASTLSMRESGGFFCEREEIWKSRKGHFSAVTHFQQHQQAASLAPKVLCGDQDTFFESADGVLELFCHPLNFFASLKPFKAKSQHTRQCLIYDMTFPSSSQAGVLPKAAYFEALDICDVYILNVDKPAVSTYKTKFETLKNAHFSHLSLEGSDSRGKSVSRAINSNQLSSLVKELNHGGRSLDILKYSIESKSRLRSFLRALAPSLFTDVQRVSGNASTGDNVDLTALVRTNKLNSDLRTLEVRVITLRLSEEASPSNRSADLTKYLSGDDDSMSLTKTEVESLVKVLEAADYYLFYSTTVDKQPSTAAANNVPPQSKQTKEVLASFLYVGSDFAGTSKHT